MIRSTAGQRLRRGLVMPLLAGVALAACGAPADGISVAAPSETSSAAPVAPSPAKPRISRAGFDYFLSIALGAEYGSEVSVVTMWTKPEVTVRIHGSAERGDACLTGVIDDFNAISTTTDLKLTGGPADIEFYFAPLSEFRSIEPDYVAGNDGYFQTGWSASYQITDANVLIRSYGIDAGVRCHLIREELTQSMGMMRDSGKYPDSIFYDEYGATPTRYSELDKEVIRLLYSGALRPGDDSEAIRQAVTIT